MPSVPGYMMSDEPYTLTEEQIDALNAMPPGLYFVCAGCRKFKPTPVTITFKGMDEMVCEECA